MSDRYKGDGNDTLSGCRANLRAANQEVEGLLNERLALQAEIKRLALQAEITGIELATEKRVRAEEAQKIAVLASIIEKLSQIVWHDHMPKEKP